MRPSRHKSLNFLACLVLASPVFGEEPWIVQAPGRVVAVADIHGAYDAFISILEQSGLIDASGAWRGGNDRLVIVGDVLDRGPASLQSLDRVIALQQQARASGGDVNFVLGNHEIMNIVGDLRYVPASDFAAFASADSADVRASELARFVKQRSESGDPARAQAEFDRLYPPGFFGHRAAFSSTGAYGSWLLEQPLLLIAGDTAFTHGGISRAHGEAAAEDINHELKQQLRDYVSAMESLVTVGILSAADDFYDHPAIVERFEQRVAAGDAIWPEGAEAPAQRIKELNNSALFALASPIWYRGMVSCSPLVEQDHWRSVLERLGVDRIVVGHTPTPDALVLSRMDGGIVRVDTGMLASFYGGQAAALVIEDNELAVIYAGEANAMAPTPQPRRVGGRPSRLTDDQLELMLRDAQIVSQAVTENRSRITLRDSGIEIQADFYPTERSAIRPEVAAYRLDRLLGLGMVPVTVARDLDGVAGTLQFAPSNLITETERSTLGTGGSAWCPLRDQYPAMYIFDTLVFNEGRGLEQIAYETDSFDLVLLGHARTFATQRGRPQHLRSATLELSPAWQEALQALDQNRLESALGDVLSSRQIRALSRRIEALLADAGHR